MATRKRLEMDTKSYPQEEQHLSQQSLPLSSKKSKAFSNEVIIREDRENTHYSLLIVAKDATITAMSAFQVSVIDNILPFPPLVIYSSL